MTLVKAILATILALGAFASTLCTVGTQLDPPTRCMPCSN